MEKERGRDKKKIRKERWETGRKREKKTPAKNGKKEQKRKKGLKTKMGPDHYTYNLRSSAISGTAVPVEETNKNARKFNFVA